MSSYLDNSATTPLCEAAITAMTAAMTCFGNPSSLHEVGQRSAALLRESRMKVAAALGERYLKDGQLIFTGSGTEATALALLGTANAKERREARTILTTDSEHRHLHIPCWHSLLLQPLRDYRIWSAYILQDRMSH